MSRRQALFNQLSTELARIAERFERPDEVRITLIVRTPWLADGGIVIGDDTPSEAIAEWKRLNPEAFAGRSPESKESGE